jgi:uncharacterized membrane protein YfcA
MGAYLTAKVSSHWIVIVFGLVLLYSAISSFSQKSDEAPTDRSRSRDASPGDCHVSTRQMSWQLD